MVVTGKPGFGRWNGTPVYRQTPRPPPVLRLSPGFRLFCFVLIRLFSACYFLPRRFVCALARTTLSAPRQSNEFWGLGGHEERAPEKIFSGPTRRRKISDRYQPVLTMLARSQSRPLARVLWLTLLQ